MQPIQTSLSNETTLLINTDQKQQGRSIEIRPGNRHYSTSHDYDYNADSFPAISLSERCSRCDTDQTQKSVIMCLFIFAALSCLVMLAGYIMKSIEGTSSNSNNSTNYTLH